MIVQGDARHLPLADGSVHCVVTSPPYWGLRDYGIAGQLGLEATPDCLGWATGDPCGECYICHMMAVFQEVKRVLRDDAVAFVNMGDCYTTSFYSHNSLRTVPQTNNEWSREGQRGEFNQRNAVGNFGGLKPKDLCGIPWRLAFALQADGWYLRSDIIWAKPNPMPESVTDRPTKSHEYVFLLSKSAKYYYDADAIREPNHAPRKCGPSALRGQVEIRPRGNCQSIDEQSYNPAGRNARTVWTIATEPFPGTHFATFPTALVEPCILAGTSERGCCPACGAPWRRVTSPATGGAIGASYHDHSRDLEAGMSQVKHSLSNGTYQRGETLRWMATCECDAGDPPPCTVLDPFAGSGTTGLVASRLGRRFVGVDLSRAYCAMARERIVGDAPLLYAAEPPAEAEPMRLPLEGE